MTLRFRLPKVSHEEVKAIGATLTDEEFRQYLAGASRYWWAGSPKMTHRECYEMALAGVIAKREVV